MNSKPRIAHISGSNATISSSPPLVTSNKAREKRGLHLLEDASGARLRFDALRPQRLAAPVTVYVEQFSAHPLEHDAAELYGPPDGYVDRAGGFHRERQNESDVPVYEVTLSPDDGLYPLPYMAVQADGRPWDEDCAAPNAPASHARQPFYPDGARLLEEIDRLGIDGKGLASVISSRADVDFYRVTPPGGYTKGEPPEVPGEHFFPYRPKHLAASPPRPALATITNSVQRILASGSYADARPGGYTVTGGHGGIVGAVGHEGPPTLTYIPARRHTYQSQVNIARLPAKVLGVSRAGDKVAMIPVAIKNEAGELLGSAIPKVAIVKDANYSAERINDDLDDGVDLLALISRNLERYPLSGFVLEGHAPFGTITSATRTRILKAAVYSGIPVAIVGRGNNEGFTAAQGVFIGGREFLAATDRLLAVASPAGVSPPPPPARPRPP